MPEWDRGASLEILVVYEVVSEERQISRGGRRPARLFSCVSSPKLVDACLFDGTPRRRWFWRTMPSAYPASTTTSCILMIGAANHIQ